MHNFDCDADALFNSYHSDKFPYHLRLFASIVRRATVDYVLYKNHSNIKLQKIGIDAERWLFSSNEVLFLSFESVCGYLNLDPKVVRKYVFLFTEDDARRQRGLELDAE